MTKRRHWNADKILSISAILISIMTLAVSWYQTAIIRQQQRLSVLPYLSFQNYGTGGANYKYALSNNGIGPAFIEKIYVTYKGKEYDLDLPLFLQKHTPESRQIKKVKHSNISAGNLIPAGKQINILEIDNSQTDASKMLLLLDKLKKEKLKLTIIYQSVYKERWRLESDHNIPQKL